LLSQWLKQGKVFLIAALEKKLVGLFIRKQVKFVKFAPGEQSTLSPVYVRHAEDALTFLDLAAALGWWLVSAASAAASAAALAAAAAAGALSD
jgi:hypothetical protein